MTLSAKRYLTALDVEGHRLADVAGHGLDAAVPSCPGWTMRELLLHTGSVHRHKERIVRERLLTAPEREEPEGLEGDDLIAWYVEGLERLHETLAEADPATPVTTFDRSNRTTAFWFRRMAHETAIHRIDAELAHGFSTPLDPKIAADGVDEVLSPVRAGVAAGTPFDPDERVVVVRSADTGDTWHMELGTTADGPGWRWHSGGVTGPDTVITASADVLDRWAWGRIGADALSVDGDPAVLATIRKVVEAVT
ncbi:MAG: maleylpyruvate isomerase family mycothiol-dependent enzyme [Acidimicrobiia bacterium]|nr:maleylpyruvate isomerase family mycothiol-dependent enzyme [Acidimicrobiia bacterium]